MHEYAYLLQTQMRHNSSFFFSARKQLLTIILPLQLVQDSFPQEKKNVAFCLDSHENGTCTRHNLVQHSRYRQKSSTVLTVRKVGTKHSYPSWMNGHGWREMKRTCCILSDASSKSVVNCHQCKKSQDWYLLISCLCLKESCLKQSVDLAVPV